jgi:putative ABC transport system ATP-binding protein
VIVSLSAMPAAADAVISMRDVSHLYGSGDLRRQVLFDISCDIMPGEIVIITGPSGSGKTTVLTLAGALRSVELGSMRVLNQELNGASYETLVQTRENIGFIFQAHNLLNSLTARQNVQMSLGLRRVSSGQARTRSTALLDAVGLHEQIDYLPAQLSGGQRQRVAVARALVREPKIVLADEPTAALDRQAGRGVVELLRQLARRQGCAILLVTHDNRILDIADRVMLLEDGRLSSFGTVTSPHAGHLLTALARMPAKEHLGVLMGKLGEGEFIELLHTMMSESEQFLNILDLGEQAPVKTLFENLLESILGKIADLLDAESAVIFLIEESDGRLRPIVAAGRADAAHAAAVPLDGSIAGRVARSGQILNVAPSAAPDSASASVLCVPIHNRHEQLFAVAQLQNKRTGGPFTSSDERAFRDLAPPLGVILEGSERLARDQRS